MLYFINDVNKPKTGRLQKVDFSDKVALRDLLEDDYIVCQQTGITEVVIGFIRLPGAAEDLIDRLAGACSDYGGDEVIGELGYDFVQELCDKDEDFENCRLVCAFDDFSMNEFVAAGIDLAKAADKRTVSVQ